MAGTNEKQENLDNYALKKTGRVVFAVLAVVSAVFPFWAMRSPVFSYFIESKSFIAIHMLPLILLVMIRFWPHREGSKDNVFFILLFLFSVMGFWYGPYSAVITAASAALEGVSLSETVQTVIAQAIMIGTLLLSLIMVLIGSNWRHDIIHGSEEEI